jgi:Uri superfamily endonuclease
VVKILDAKKGSYCIIMRLKYDKKIRIGKLGVFDFPEGFYVYVGSAMKNLEQRILRHYSALKKKKWHVDYFLESAEIIKFIVFPSNKKQECKITKILLDDGTIIAEKFGSTDCKCKTHLIYFVTKKELSKAISRLKKKIKQKIKTM